MGLWCLQRAIDSTLAQPPAGGVMMSSSPEFSIPSVESSPLGLFCKETIGQEELLEDLGSHESSNWDEDWNAGGSLLAPNSPQSSCFFFSASSMHPEDDVAVACDQNAANCCSEAGSCRDGGAKLEFGESMALLLDQENSPRYLPCKLYVESLKTDSQKEKPDPCLVALRRKWVLWILKLQKLLQLGIPISGRAVSMLDRFVSFQGNHHDLQHCDMKLVAIACLWIAAKYDGSHALDMQLQVVPELQYDASTIQRMELTVLRALGWSAATITAYDFIANMIHHLITTMGFPQHALRGFESRTDELVGGILPEGAFLGYQPSVVGMCVIQCLLDEYAPLQSACVMDSLRRTVAVDMISAWDCYQLLMDLVVDPVYSNKLPSPNHVADLYNPRT